MDNSGCPYIEKLRAEADVGGLIETLRYYQDCSLRTEAVKALVQLGPVALEPLIAALKDSCEGVRFCAAHTLWKIGDARAVEPLIAALGDRDPDVRLKAAVALGDIGDERAIKPLIDALKNDMDLWNPKYIAKVLGRFNDGKAIGPLIDALKGEDEDSELCLRVARELEEIGNTYASLTRWKVALALGEIGDPRAVEPLIAALGSKVKSVPRCAAFALGKIGDARAVEPLIDTLKDGDGYVREAAAEVLGEIGDARAMDPLIAALTDKVISVRDKAIRALDRIRDAKASRGS
jgi:HEAT repeat protein